MLIINDIIFMIMYFLMRIFKNLGGVKMELQNDGFSGRTACDFQGPKSDSTFLMSM